MQSRTNDAKARTTKGFEPARAEKFRLRPTRTRIVHSKKRGRIPGVSRAFIKEDDSVGSAPIVAPRAPLPEHVPNYVTERGLRLLDAELAALRAAPESEEAGGQRALRLTELEARRASAVLVEAASQPQDEVRFGATVKVRGETQEERTFRIVGVDEADAAVGRIAFTAPLARALLGKRTGDAATVRAPRGEEELEIVAIHYEVDESP